MSVEQMLEPSDVSLEQALLGQLLADNAKVDVAAAELDSSAFSDPLHARIYDLALTLKMEGTPVTPVILQSLLRHDPGIVTMGVDYFHRLEEAAPIVTSTVAICGLLKELSYRRQLRAIGRELDDAAQESGREISSTQLSADATDRLLAIGAKTNRPILSATEIAMESVRALEAAKHGTPVPMVRTGLMKLDREIGGFKGGHFIVIGGKSGMGKSAAMGTICRNVSAGHSNFDFTAKCAIEVPPRPTIVFSLEMTRNQWVERMACDADYNEAIGAGLKSLWYSKVGNGTVDDDEFTRFALASQGLPPKHLLEIHDEDDLTMAQIAARARAFKAKCVAKFGPEVLGLVIIDYIQIIQPSDWRLPREQQVAGNARGCKSLAKRLGWPVAAGTQFNEDDKGRSKEEKRPQLGDARESKAIGQEADQFFSPYRHAYFVENRKPVEAKSGDPDFIAWKGELARVQHRLDWLTLKNRHGRRFDLELHCDIAASAIRDHLPGRASTPDDLVSRMSEPLDGVEELEKRAGE